ncbi:MAG: SurA N-terminal domain-containing protein [Bacteriovoracaceae bacterium]|nr:SurA N-terminal domain-containing protein [Bacteriovoracaceae bacterium]
MVGTFQKKTSSFLVTILIGLIVISFMFGGYNTMQGTPDTIARVGDKLIKIEEFRTEYSRQLTFYNQMFGRGKSLTSKQIERFKIRENTLRLLIDRKLLLLFSEKMGVTPSASEIKEEIKNLPYFKTNDQFDISRYKQLLTANRLTPARFEADIAQGLQNTKARTLAQNIPLSSKYIEDLGIFKKQKRQIDIVKFSKDSLKEFIPITDKELTAYLSKKENLTKVQAIFNGQRPSLDQKESIEARHILLSTTPETESEVKQKIEKLAKSVTIKNFNKLANKNTTDPSGKENGGYLGWFSRGKMVPEFEKVAFAQKVGTISKPVKTEFGYHIIYVVNKKEKKDADFKDHKDKIAKDQIRKNKGAEIKKLSQKLSKNIKGYLTDNKWKALDKYQKKYKLTYEKEVVINLLEGASGTVTLTSEQLDKLFTQQLSSPKVLVFDDLLSTTILRISKHQESKEGEKFNPKTEKEKRQSALSKNLYSDLISAMKKSVSIKTFNVF